MEDSLKNHEGIRQEDQQLLQDIGKEIRMLRKAKKLSYIELAKAVGISRNTYNQIELGQTKFKIGMLISILEFHDITLKQFLEDMLNK